MVIQLRELVEEELEEEEARSGVAVGPGGALECERRFGMTGEIRNETFMSKDV